ncbi:hypothetical protein NIIDNTM18_47910 [Mycolicibacterium litorale]|uniref:Uncharacterized protein n=1 Tax=Mycolicibacterium litorale TaxID=758802 RepID=A0A6S6P6K8_9MYCO|nr:hypothetical protein NIIDNTM18_47910 [Mycolicibacterium litorale]
MSIPHSHFLSLPDLASRVAGGAVVWANDELFAEKENLIVAALGVFGRLTDDGLRGAAQTWSLSG